MMNLWQVSEENWSATPLSHLFSKGWRTGRPPPRFGDAEKVFRQNPNFLRPHSVFTNIFNGDNGAGIGVRGHQDRLDRPLSQKAASTEWGVRMIDLEKNRSAPISRRPHRMNGSRRTASAEYMHRQPFFREQIRDRYHGLLIASHANRRLGPPSSWPFKI